MANPEHLAKLNEGVEAWNAWRKANPEIVPDLSGARLGVAALSGAILSGASLIWADLGAARLNGAHLDAADLRYTNFSNALLSRAILRGANLTLANLNGADLNETDLTEVHISGTVFGDNDLSDVKGLETVLHGGPSTIGIDTIYRSQGKIPLKFLRGAGVPDNFIEYMGSLTGKAFEYDSCFISHSSEDKEFADRLYADLQNNGVRCWFAPHDMRGGEYTHVQIDRAIQVHERLLLILSPNSMKSNWVKREILKAREREVVEKERAEKDNREAKRVLFPIGLVPFKDLRDWEYLDSDTGEDLAKEIRKYHIPDFSNWKSHDQYAEGLKNLLRDLKAEASNSA